MNPTSSTAVRQAESVQPPASGADAPAPAGRTFHTRVPVPDHPNGPVTRSHLRRTFAGIASFWVVGAVALIAGSSPGWNAFGLGMLIPGGGFVYTSDPLLAVASLAAFALSLVIFWAIAPVLLPPAIWIGSAALAATRVDTGLWDWALTAVPAALVLGVALAAAVHQLNFLRLRRHGRELNERLEKVTFELQPKTAAPPVTESSPEDLAALRYGLDLALQPLDSWEGFHFADQFREAAVRYQLNFIQYSAAASQYTRTPAFSGYLAQAQRNAIEKMVDPRVWRYWRWENLWGNLRWNPDPVGRDNVMLSGYYGTMLGLYESLNGDDRYAAPGALTFERGRRESYPYDFTALARQMRHNLLTEPFCMFACEPTWIYPYCSSYALNTVITHDRLHGGDSSDVIERFRESFDRDFMRPDGRLVAIRNGRFGFALDLAATTNDAVLVPWLNPGLPELAQRIWWIMRDQMIDLDGPEVLTGIRDFDRVDVGNYRPGSDVYARTVVLLAAREMGDDEAADAIQRSIDERAQRETHNGASRYAKLSVWGNLAHTLGRFTRRDTMREMIAYDIPREWATGPRLAGADYPDVLVARAVTDGRALDLVLRPGAGPVRTTLSIDRLVPGGEYRVEGAATGSLVADDHGCAQVTDVDLGDRIELRVRPL